MTTLLRWLLAAVALTATLICGGLATRAHEWGAAALLYPSRIATIPPTPEACVDRRFNGHGIVLNGWYCRSVPPTRGTIVYLHGIADNRGSSRGVIQRYVVRGYDVVAYDSRRHGTSEGDICTYGFLEKNDLRAVIDSLEAGPVILIGASLGAAVALQTAAIDNRVSAVVAAEVFSDLRTIATERAPFMLPNWFITRAFQTVERRGGFQIEAVSPVDAARKIRVPVMLIHGDADIETRAAHSQRVLEALAGPKELILVPAAGHNQSLGSAAVWAEIDRWIDAAARSTAS